MFQDCKFEMIDQGGCELWRFREYVILGGEIIIILSIRAYCIIIPIIMKKKTSVRRVWEDSK